MDAVIRNQMREFHLLGKPAGSGYGTGMDDPELWLCHFVGGAWRAPLGTRMAPVMVRGRGVVARVVLASDADLERAQAARRPTPRSQAMRYRALVAAMPDAPTGPAAPPRCLRNGAIYLAAPQDAAFARRLALGVARAGLRPGAFALLFQA